MHINFLIYLNLIFLKKYFYIQFHLYYFLEIQLYKFNLIKIILLFYKRYNIYILFNFIK